MSARPILVAIVYRNKGEENSSIPFYNGETVLFFMIVCILFNIVAR